MAADFQRINAPRVTKIIDTLTLIDTSAKSQRVTRGDVRNLLDPIYRKLGVSTPLILKRPVEEFREGGEITKHDGDTVTFLKFCLRRGTPDEVRAALEWCIKHNAMKAQD
jgi:hypothetical protein